MGERWRERVREMREVEEDGGRRERERGVIEREEDRGRERRERNGKGEGGEDKCIGVVMGI